MKFTERRRGRADGDAPRRRPPGRRAARVRRARHRHRPDAEGIGAAVPVVLAGRLEHHAQVRRHRPRPGDQQAAGRADGRHDVGRERRPGHGSTFSLHDRGAASPSCPPASAATSSACSPSCTASACWWSTTTRPTARMLALQAASGAWRRATPSRRPRRCAGSTRRRALRPRDPRHAHAGDGRPRAGAPHPRARPDAAAGAVQLARPARGRRRRSAVRAPTWPSRCASRSCSTRWSACSAHDARRRARAGARPRRRSSIRRMAARHPLRILLAEDNVGEPEARAAPAAADGLPRRPRAATASRRSSRSSARPTTWC